MGIGWVSRLEGSTEIMLDDIDLPAGHIGIGGGHSVYNTRGSVRIKGWWRRVSRSRV